MNNLPIILLLVFITLNGSFAQDNDLLVKDIRKNYYHIRENLDSYDTTMIQIWDESTEGGEAIGFYDKEEVKLVEVVLLGETGKHKIEYYFHNGKLIFVFNQKFVYNRPIYWDEQTAKANGDDEFFDPNKTTVTEDRYYFNDEKLFLWLDNDRNEVDLAKGNNAIAGKRLIADSYKLRDELKLEK